MDLITNSQLNLSNMFSLLKLLQEHPSSTPTVWELIFGFSSFPVERDETVVIKIMSSWEKDCDFKCQACQRVMTLFPLRQFEGLILNQFFGSRPGKLVQEWSQHFAGLEPTYVRAWGQDCHDQQGQLKPCDHHFEEKKNPASLASSLSNPKVRHCCCCCAWR